MPLGGFWRLLLDGQSRCGTSKLDWLQTLAGGRGQSGSLVRMDRIQAWKRSCRGVHNEDGIQQWDVQSGVRRDAVIPAIRGLSDVLPFWFSPDGSKLIAGYGPEASPVGTLRVPLV